MLRQFTVTLEEQNGPLDLRHLVRVGLIGIIIMWW
jgi:hypothetical protein